MGNVVAAVDAAPSLAGTPLINLVPTADAKLRILPNLDAVTNWDDIDVAIVATSSDLPGCLDTFKHLLSKGKAVISTCEELVYPWLHHVALAEELDEIATRNGGRLLGTGVNPGFLMEALPTFLTCVSKSVRAISAHRIQDASSRRVPFQRKIGVGLTPDQFADKVREGTLRHVGLGESLHYIAHYVGLPVEHWEEDITPVIATRDMASALGTIAKGNVCGVRQVAKGYFDERETVHLEFQASIGQDNPHDRAIVYGEPNIDMVIPGGVHGDIATSAIVVNAIPRILEAQPGLHTMATIAPPIHARAGLKRF